MAVVTALITAAEAVAAESFSNQTPMDGGTGKSNTVDDGSGGTANKVDGGNGNSNRVDGGSSGTATKAASVLETESTVAANTEQSSRALATKLRVRASCSCFGVGCVSGLAGKQQPKRNHAYWLPNSMAGISGSGNNKRFDDDSREQQPKWSHASGLCIGEQRPK